MAAVGGVRYVGNGVDASEVYTTGRCSRVGGWLGFGRGLGVPVWRYQTAVWYTPMGVYLARLMCAQRRREKPVIQLG